MQWHCSWAGAKADPLSDAIEIDGLLVQPVHRPLVYLLLNKPVGVVSPVMTHKTSVLDLLSKELRDGEFTRWSLGLLYRSIAAYK